MTLTLDLGATKYDSVQFYMASSVLESFNALSHLFSYLRHKLRARVGHQEE